MLFPSRVALRLLYLRLKSLKFKLRQLNPASYGDISARTRAAYANLCSKQTQTLLTPSSVAFEEEKAAPTHWHLLVTAEEKFYKQKSRITWLNHDDHNTGFFHRVASSRAFRTTIKRLVTSYGEILTDFNDIKAEAVSHFKSFLQQRPDPEPLHSPSLAELLTYRCPTASAVSLCLPVLAAEIKSTLFSMPSNKALGPDGYTTEFYKAAWPIIGNDFVAAIQAFFIYAFLPRGVNAMLVALIPKGDHPQIIKDYPSPHILL